MCCAELCSSTATAGILLLDKWHSLNRLLLTTTRNSTKGQVELRWTTRPLRQRQRLALSVIWWWRVQRTQSAETRTVIWKPIQSGWTQKTAHRHMFTHRQWRALSRCTCARSSSRGDHENCRTAGSTTSGPGARTATLRVGTPRVPTAD